jgi:hypothetical protein
VLPRAPAKKLSPAEVAEVEDVVTLARAGHATLSQLARAHDLANGANLNGTVGELREHIRRATPRAPMRDEMRSIVLGFLSGLATHAVLESVSQRRKR